MTRIATLTTVAEFVTNGAQNAINSAEKVKNSMVGVESAAQALTVRTQALENAERALNATRDTSSATVAKQRAELQQSVDAYRQLDNIIANVDQALKSQGSSFETLAADIKVAQQEFLTLEQQEKDLVAEGRRLSAVYKQLGDASRKLNPREQKAEFEALTKAMERQNEAIKENARLQREARRATGAAAGRAGALVGIQGELAGFGGVQTEALAQITKQTSALATTMPRAERSTRGFLRTLLQTNNGSLFTAASLASLAGRLTGLGAAAVAVIQVFRRITASFEGLAAASAFPQLEDETRRWSGSLNIADSQLGALLVKTQNLARSFGIMNSDEAAGEIARLAAQGRNVLPGRDAARAQQLVESAVFSGGGEGLREFGIDPQVVKNAEEAVRQQNEAFTEQELVLARLTAVQAAFSSEQGRMAQAGEQAVPGFAELKAEVLGLFDIIARSLMPVLGPLVQSFGQLIVAVSPLAPLFFTTIGIVADLITVIAKFVTFVISKVGPALAQGARFFAKFLEPFKDLPLFRAFHSALETTADEIDRMVAGLDQGADDAAKFTANTADAIPPLRELKSAADRAKEALSERISAHGLVGAARSVADSLAAMEEELNFETVGATLENFDNLLSQVMQNGVGSIEMLRLQARQLNKVGLLPDNALQEANALYDALEAVVAPIEREAQRLRDEMGGVGPTGTEAFGNVTTAVQTTTSNVEVATSTTQNYIATLNSIPSEVSTSIILRSGGVVDLSTSVLNGRQVRPSGSSAGERVSIRGTGSSAGERDTTRGPTRRATMGLGNQPSERVAQIREEQTAFEDAIAKLRSVGQGPTGGGGGGGGGAAGASIEEIRQLFRNIGQLIKIGVNKGVFFSPAGNTIPLGGPNEFLNTQGGTVIQTLNIRGIWDFADPAAKRQIIKELEEALAGLKSEVK